MHAALRLDEVVADVVQFLPFRDVLAVARVCRDWYAVAIGVYWDNKVVTVDRLLSLLPLSQHKPLTFSRALTSDAFSPVLAVAPNIRNLLLRFWPPIDHRVFDLLSDRASHAFKAPISLGLRRLEWRISAQSHVRMFVELLSPSIRTISVSFPNTESAFDLAKMFGAVSALSPHTQSLTVSILYPSHTFTEAFVQCIRTLDLRQAFLQFNISPAALRVLAGLPHLEALDCECHSDLGAWEPAVPARLFPSLKRLRINGYHPAFMTILETITRPFALESLQLNIGDGLECTLGQTLSLLGSAAPQLRTLVLRTHTAVLKSVHPPDPGLVATVPPALLQCHLLETLHIVYPYQLQWDDADLARLARALPRLRNLRLNAYPALRPTAPRATLDAVRSFAAHCPRLLELVLFVLVTPPATHPTTASSSTLSLSSEPQPHTSLRIIDFGKSPLAYGVSPEDVAHTVLRLFPCLDELRSAETDISEVGCLWETPENARARSAQWDTVRATYSAVRGRSVPPSLQEKALDAHDSERESGAEPEPPRTTPPTMDSAMFDTVTTWPFA